MPIYEYRCPHCDRAFERLERIGAEQLEVRCPHCEQTGAQRIPSAFASATGSCGPSGSGGAPT